MRGSVYCFQIQCYLFLIAEIDSKHTHLKIQNATKWILCKTTKILQNNLENNWVAYKLDYIRLTNLTT